MPANSSTLPGSIPDRNQAPLLRLAGVTKQYPDGTRALRGIDLEIQRGEGVVLLGHNGSGKSTLMRCMNGLERPTSGQVVIDGQDISQLNFRRLRPIRRRIGMVFQHFNLIDNVSVFQNVLFGSLGRNRLWSALSLTASTEDRDRAMHCLQRVGLADRAESRGSALSGGQQQRVAIARMLMQEPEIVLADEPIASLDPRAGRKVMDLLWSIVEERGMTVICTLHQLEFALAYGQRLIGLKGGLKVLDDPRSAHDEQTLGGLYEQDPTQHQDTAGSQAATEGTPRAAARAEAVSLAGH